MRSTSGAASSRWGLRQDPRVVVLERTNVRTLDAGSDRRRRRPRGGRPLVHLAPCCRARAGACATPDADLVLLVKPQFEAGRGAGGPGRDRARPRRAPGGARRGRGGARGASRPRRSTWTLAAPAAPTATSSSSFRCQQGGVPPIDAAAVDAARGDDAVAARAGVTRRVGLVPHRDRPVAHELAARAAGWLRGARRRGPGAGRARRRSAPGSTDLACDRRDFADGLDVAISLGGDGTMLRTVDLVVRGGRAGARA